MLSIDFFGQACTAIHCHRTGVEIVSDPWFSNAAHIDSWHPFPEWTPNELETIRTRLDRATHVYLSHDHADHFDAKFLRTLSRKTIIVGDFKNLRFRKQLDELSSYHDINFVRHGEVVVLNDSVTVQVFLQQPAFRTDSTMLITSPDAVILNANDCGLNSSTLRRLARTSPPTVFLFTLNYMASGYPISYFFGNDPTFSFRMDAVRNDVVKVFQLAIESLRPKLAVAFAGPVTYGDAVNNHLNSHPESCDWTAMLAEVQQKGPTVWPAPFSRIECVDRSVSSTSIAEWNVYRDRKPNASSPVPSASFTEAEILVRAEGFSAALGDVLRQMERVVHTRLVLSGVASLNQIEADEFDWTIEIDFDLQKVRFLGKTSPSPPFLQIVAPSRTLWDFLARELNVDELLLSARGRFKRDPDTFNQVLHNLLRYGGDEWSAKALIDWSIGRATCSETIEVNVDGKSRRIPRLCPHEGEALDAAPIVNNVLVCPRHRWKFDLTTGQCVVGDRSVNLFDLVEQVDV